MTAEEGDRLCEGVLAVLASLARAAPAAPAPTARESAQLIDLEYERLVEKPFQAAKAAAAAKRLGAA